MIITACKFSNDKNFEKIKNLISQNKLKINKYLGFKGNIEGREIAYFFKLFFKYLKTYNNDFDKALNDAFKKSTLNQNGSKKITEIIQAYSVKIYE